MVKSERRGECEITRQRIHYWFYTENQRHELKAFKQLLEQAEKEAAALSKTMHQLRCFDLSVEFEDVREDELTEGL